MEWTNKKKLCFSLNWWESTDVCVKLKVRNLKTNLWNKMHAADHTHVAIKLHMSVMILAYVEYVNAKA